MNTEREKQKDTRKGGGEFAGVSAEDRHEIKVKGCEWGLLVKKGNQDATARLKGDGTVNPNKA